MRPVSNVASINDITIVGTVVSSPEVVSEYSGTTLYSVYFSTQRLSNIADTVEVIFKDELLYKVTPGAQKLICGEIRTKNEYADNKGKAKLIIYVFAKDIIDVSDCEYNINFAIIDGYLCKQPAYRKTYSGKSICDLLLAVNGRYGKSYYLPAVSFNENADKLSKMSVGDRVVVCGRLQSRQYTQSNINYTVYELFISDIKEFTDGTQV